MLFFESARLLPSFLLAHCYIIIELDSACVRQQKFKSFPKKKDAERHKRRHEEIISPSNISSENTREGSHPGPCLHIGKLLSLDSI